MTNTPFPRRQFLKAGGFGVLGAFARRTHGWTTESRFFYVGTYTAASKSEGIYLCVMDPLTGHVTIKNSFKSVNPSFLTIDRTKRFLYAVNEVGEYLGKPGGAVSAYAIDPLNFNLRLKNEQATKGADPCHLTLNRQGTTLLVANYTGGSLTSLPVRSDGTIGMVTEVKQHEGSGPKEQQKGPHAHCVILDAAERYALAADLGIDKVMIYRFDPTTGKLTPGTQSSADLQQGAGPRHLKFHPSGKYLYVISELDSTMTAFKYDALKGTLTQIETVSTLPADFSGVSYCADVHVHPSGKFLYGSNRGHNSIVVFEIDRRTSKLKTLQHVATGGDWPRNFAIDPSGEFLLVANQRSDNIVTFSIDRVTGELKPTGHITEIPVPVCLRF